MRPIDRRDFLRGGTLALLGLAACGGDGGGTPRATTTGAGGTFKDLIAGRAQNLGVNPAMGEALARPDERIPFVLSRPGDVRNLYRGGSGRIWLAESQASAPVGPFDLTFHDEGLREAEEWTQGIYSARVSIPRDGLWLALVEATPEGASGTLVGGAQFAAGRRYQQPVPGEDAVSVATPTEEDHRGVEPYCTRKPPCAMHGVSLDRALGSGKPTVVIIATPAFCQTRFCGPEVDVVQSVAAELREVDFIHIEVYENDEEAPSRGANGLAPAAAAWKLEEEPVTYFIGSTGKIAGRFLGPAAADEVRAAAQDLT